jgi:hypothetical protein
MVRESLRAQTSQKVMKRASTGGALATVASFFTNLAEERSTFVSQGAGRQTRPGVVLVRGARRGKQQGLLGAAERAHEDARRLGEAVVPGPRHPHYARKVGPLGAVLTLHDGRGVVGRAAADAVVRLRRRIRSLRRRRVDARRPGERLDRGRRRKLGDVHQRRRLKRICYRPPRL